MTVSRELREPISVRVAPIRHARRVRVATDSGSAIDRGAAIDFLRRGRLTPNGRLSGPRAAVAKAGLGCRPCNGIRNESRGTVAGTNTGLRESSRVAQWRTSRKARGIRAVPLLR